MRYVARAAVQDPSPRVRKSAVKALQRLNTKGPRPSSAARWPTPIPRCAWPRSRRRFDQRLLDVERVVALLGDESRTVRRRAAETLGSMQVADAVVGLVALAGSDEESDDVRAAAIWALGQIGDSAGRPVVQAQDGSSSASVRSAVAIALRSL